MNKLIYILSLTCLAFFFCSNAQKSTPYIYLHQSGKTLSGINIENGEVLYTKTFPGEITKIETDVSQNLYVITNQFAYLFNKAEGEIESSFQMSNMSEQEFGEMNDPKYVMKMYNSGQALQIKTDDYYSFNAVIFKDGIVYGLNMAKNKILKIDMKNKTKAIVYDLNRQTGELALAISKEQSIYYVTQLNKVENEFTITSYNLSGEKLNQYSVPSDVPFKSEFIVLSSGSIYNATAPFNKVSTYFIKESKTYELYYDFIKNKGEVIQYDVLKQAAISTSNLLMQQAVVKRTDCNQQYFGNRIAKTIPDYCSNYTEIPIAQFPAMPILPKKPKKKHYKAFDLALKDHDKKVQEVSKKFNEDFKIYKKCIEMKKYADIEVYSDSLQQNKIITLYDVKGAVLDIYYDKYISFKNGFETVFYDMISKEELWSMPLE